MKRSSKSRPIEIDIQELETILEQSRTQPLSDEQRKKLRDAFETLLYLRDRIQGGDATIRRLREILFGPQSERSKDILDGGGNATDGADSAPKYEKEKPSPKNYGRNGADQYTGAKRLTCKHETLKDGDRCPNCKKGKLRKQSDPERVIRIYGHPPVEAMIFELERLRCTFCGEIFTAKGPGDVGKDKYDASAAAMIALLKYGTGVPFARLESFQNGFGLPLPASTQWDVVDEAASKVDPVRQHLIRVAALGEVLHHDDTTAKILSLVEVKVNAVSGSTTKKRTPAHSSGIVSIAGDRRIALFFTGTQHAGMNLRDVLAKRAQDLPPPIQMCDALAANHVKEFETILSNCLAHGRREFVEIRHEFPEECRFVIEKLAEVYRHDAHTKEAKLEKEARLRYHQEHSAPVMRELHEWLRRQLDEKLVEPNGLLGKAIQYMTKRWEELTVFLRVAGAPLDNNLCERVLKKVILHRKNSLFFKSERGAEVSDIYFSLIVTAQLHEVSPFDYLKELIEHHVDAGRQPELWMPWNYREQLAASTDASPEA